tara:strand:- start:173 stop:874 length:702 start_codon:yes stop_codon:yes gene_type:complete
MKKLLITFVILNIGCAAEMQSTTAASNEPATTCVENCIGDKYKISANDLQGKVSDGTFENHQALKIDVDNQEVVMAIPLPLGVIAGLPPQAIPELEGAYYMIGMSSEGYSQIEVHIPFEHFLGNYLPIPADRLPNGDPLPAVPGGELPKFALKIQEAGRDIHIYIAPGLVGAYVTTPEFNPYLYLQFPIKNRNETKILGYVALVPEKLGYDGGVYIATKLPDGFARFLDEILP